MSRSPFTPSHRADNWRTRFHLLEGLARQHIVILDGAMGTMIQLARPSEDDFRGERFADWPSDLQGNNDLLSLTRPHLIRSIHRDYLSAGAYIIETNSFAATSIAQADYGLAEYAYEISYESARIAVAARQQVEANDPAGGPRFVAGAIGPTNRTASLSPDVNDPGFRAVTFDELADAYGVSARGLLDGGADILMIETIFDTLNAKAAIAAIMGIEEEEGATIPLIISGTITDLSGRTLSGQTVEAFWISVAHSNPFAVGLNCALGHAEMRAHVAELSRLADTLVSAYPNAGLPNAMGEYEQSPAEMAEAMADWAKSGMLNIAGGCCGSTPDHIRAIAEALVDLPPRQPAMPPGILKLSGLEPLRIGN